MTLSHQLGQRAAGSRLKWLTLAAGCFALFMAILDNLVVNVALPTISRDLNASTTQLQWIVSAYTLVFASLQITAGGLGDRFGRKRWFLLGIVIFTATSAMAALSQNIEMLIVARAMQGLGAALIMPLSLSLISEAFPPEERGKALGIWSAVSVSGLALGPIVGGVLVEYASWHWIFLVNVPVGVAAFFVTLSAVRESRDTSGTVATDVPGTLLVTGAIGTLTYGLIEASNRGWGDGLILGAFGAAVVLTVAFIWVEAHTARPMVPLRFFRSPTFSGANIAAFAVAFGIAGFAFFWTLYQQNIHGFSAVRAGLSMIPVVAVMMVASPISGLLVGRVGASRLLAMGLTLAAAGMLLFMRGGVDASYVDIIPSQLVLGLGMALIFAPMTTAVMNSVETAKSGIASAVNGAVREIGTAFGIALLGTVMNRVYQSRFDGSEQVTALRSDPALGPIQPVVDLIGSGASFAGRAVEDPRILPALGGPGAIVDQLREASATAFIGGMDRALIVAALVLVAAAGASLVLINDRVVNAVPAPAGADQPDQEAALVEGVAAD